MAKKEEGAAALIDDRLTLDEFCADLSRTDKRVELIGGFHFQEKRAGRMKDSASAYSKRFGEFADAPA